MHILQKNILDQLRQTESLRYAQLQPKHIESSHFKYHLNGLKRDGLVEQRSRGVYALTAKGMAAVDKLSEGRVNPHQTPKVITYTLLTDGQHYYLARKNKEPYLGLLNMIGGKLHLGENATVAATRELTEKIGVTNITPKLRGTASVQIRQAGELLTHAMAYVFIAEVDTAFDADGLVKVEASELTTRPDLAPDLLGIVAAIHKAREPFVVELDIDWQRL